MRFFMVLAFIALVVSCSSNNQSMNVKNIYQFEVEKIGGEKIKLEEYRGKVMLIVNTASLCGFTEQYEGLQKLYEEHKDDGFVVLGFPSNQFGNQEPGTNDEIAEFCSLNYGISFPIFAKIDVNGENAHPLYKYLKEESSGFLISKIKWNFTKFLIDRNGKVIDRYSPMTKPEKIENDILKLIN